MNTWKYKLNHLLLYTLYENVELVLGDSFNKILTIRLKYESDMNISIKEDISEIVKEIEYLWKNVGFFYVMDLELQYENIKYGINMYFFLVIKIQEKDMGNFSLYKLLN